MNSEKEALAGLRIIRQDFLNRKNAAESAVSAAEEIIKQNSSIKYAEIVRILESEGHSRRSISSAVHFLYDRGLLYDV